MKQNTMVLDIGVKIFWKLRLCLTMKDPWQQRKKIWFLVGVRICIFCIEDKQASESATKGVIQKLHSSNQNEVRGRSQTTWQVFGFFWLPTPLRWQFLTYKSWHFMTIYLPLLENVVCEQPLWGHSTTTWTRRGGWGRGQ